MPTPHHSRSVKPATPKQQALLRQLADQTGSTFSPPTSSADASRQIEAMLKRDRSTRDERRLERRDLDRALATQRGDAARVRPGETTGYGSTARWNVAPLKGEVR